MDNSDNLAPHLPKHYIAGVYVPQNDQWTGDFAVTIDNLMSFTSHELVGYRELELLEAMMDTQQIYENWWRKVKIK